MSYASSSKRLNPSKSQGPARASHATRDDSADTTQQNWQNRIFRCLVITPAGRTINRFASVRELLETLRDAIRAHQSLFTNGKILHRDISPSIIIITDLEAPGSFKGMLIDLDVAKVMNSAASGARHITGTLPFMSISVMNRNDHTCRDDLESFLYVLIWMCASRA